MSAMGSRRRWRGPGLALLIAMLGFAAYRIVALQFAHPGNDPAGGARWQSQQSDALLVRAESALAQGRLAEAAAVTRRLLTVAPLEGRGFRVLADVARRQGEDARAQVLYAIAARRSPRDLATRVWLAQYAWQAGDPAAAMRQFDLILRVIPGARDPTLMVLRDLRRDPRMAHALAGALASAPSWAGRWRELQAAASGSTPLAVDGRGRATFAQAILASSPPRPPVPAGR